MGNQAELTAEQLQAVNAVYIPAFLEKCAERGHEIASEEDLQGLMEISAAYKMQSEGTKRSTIKEASAALKRATGLDQVEEQERQAMQIKESAERFGENEAIRSVLTKLVAQPEE
jgi:hypothetical protein